MLLMISLYRLPEFLIGPVAGPFYSDLGLSKDIVGGIRASVGLFASILGIAAGGLSALRLGSKARSFSVRCCRGSASPFTRSSP